MNRLRRWWRRFWDGSDWNLEGPGVMRPVNPGLLLPSGWNPVTYAANQPQYRPLPCWRSRQPDGRVVTRWKLTRRERLMVALGTDLWLQQLTFHQPLQPILPTVGRPELEGDRT
jgi:hypothetical protein